MKKIIGILLSAVILCMLVFSACALDNKPSESDQLIDITAEDFDPTTPILSIGDQKVSFAIYNALYDSYLPYMQSTGFDPLASRSSLESFQDWLTESLAKDLVILHQAETNGFELTAEQEAELAKNTEDELNELYETYMDKAREDYEADPSVVVEAYFANYVEKMSKYYTGTAMNWEDYKVEYAKEARRSYVIEQYKEAVCSEFIPTSQDITGWYDSQYDTNKTSYTNYPSKYKTDEEYYEMYFGEKDDAYPILYVPAGYSRMMHIIVSPSGELSDEYNTMIARMDEIKSEYAELAFADAVAGTDEHAAEMDALITEYVGLKADTDAEYASYTAAASEKIGQAYAALRAGQPFAEVMMDYTEDAYVVGGESYAGCKAFQEKGQLISTEHASTKDWSEGIKAEFAKLNKGEYSEVFMDNGSYHIIYYVADEPAGDVELKSVYSDIEAVCKTGVNNAQWDALVEEWLNDPELVKNEALIRAIGAADVTEKE